MTSNKTQMQLFFEELQIPEYQTTIANNTVVSGSQIEIICEKVYNAEAREIQRLNSAALFTTKLDLTVITAQINRYVRMLS